MTPDDSSRERQEELDRETMRRDFEREIYWSVMLGILLVAAPQDVQTFVDEWWMENATHFLHFTSGYNYKSALAAKLNEFLRARDAKYRGVVEAAQRVNKAAIPAGPHLEAITVLNAALAALDEGKP